MMHSNKKKDTAIFIAVVTIMTVFTYHSVLFGNRYFLSSGNAMDMYDQFYPRLLTVARGLANGNFGPHIDFTYGVGLEVNYNEFSLNNIPAYFGEQNIAYLLGICQTIKVIISALFFYLYVKMLGVSRFVSYVAGISYAYCGHMIIRQYWLSYSNEIFLFALWLWAFELFLKNNKKWLPIITLFFMLSMSSLYYIILYTGIFTLYTVIRLETIYNRRNFLKYFLILGTGILLISIIAIGPTTIINQFFNIFSSSRFQNGITSENNPAPFALFTNSTNLASLFFRTIGIDINGVKNNYFGQYGILGDATFYIGLLPLAFLPLTLYSRHGKEKNWFLFICLCGIIYILSDDFRKLCNGFSSENFKLSSFWITFFSLYCFATGADNFFQKPTKLKIIYLLCTNGIIIIISKSLLHKYYSNIQIKYLLAAVSFMCLYQFLFVLYFYCCARRKQIKILIFSLFLFEITFTSYSRIKNMNLDLKEWVDGRNGYNDYTLESIEKINKLESIKAYRIDKQFFSYRYNDPMAQNYYGTSFYFGGTGIGNDIISFYDKLKLPTAEAGYNYAFGTSISDEINSILGIKYLLAQNNSIKNFGYELIDDQNGIYTYRNQLSLPLVFVYNQYISSNDFEKLSLDEKKCALLQACVVDPADVEYSLDSQTLPDDIFNWKEISSYNEYMADYNHDSHDNCIYIPDYDVDSAIVIKVEFNLDTPEYRGMLKYFLSDGTEISYKVRIENCDSYTFEINANDVDRILFTDENGGKINYHILSCHIFPQNVYYQYYLKCIENLQKNSMLIHNILYNELHGTIYLDEPGILFFSSPFSNWQIFIDGEEAKSFVVNIGFTGCNISSGEHEISFIYEDNSSSIDKYIQNGLLILFGGYFIFCLLKKRKGTFNVRISI